MSTLTSVCADGRVLRIARREPMSVSVSVPTMTRAAPASSSRDAVSESADPRVHPRLRSEVIAQLTDDLSLVAPAFERVEVGDVHGLAVTLAAEGPGDGHWVAAGDEPAAHGAVVLPFAAQPLHHSSSHEV